MDRKPAAYIRKSKRADDSAAAQLDAVRALAARDGVVPDTLVVFDDNGQSGDRTKLHKRRGYQAMVEAVERDEISVLYVRVLDRLGRDLEEGLRLYRVLGEHDVDIVDQFGRRSGEDGEDRVMMEFWAAKRELRSAKQRSAFTKARREARGDVVVGGHAAPYGFLHVRAGEAGVDGDPDRIVRVANPDEPVEPLLAAVADTGGSVLKAAKLLNDRGVPSRGGRGWEPRTLARVVDAHKGFRLRGRGRSPRNGAEPAPLARLVACHCGTLMTPTRDPRNRRWLSLYCARGHKFGAAEHGPYTARARHVIDRLRADLAGSVEKSSRTWTTDPEAAAARRADLERRRRLLGIALADETIDLDAYAARKDAIDAELTDLNGAYGQPFSITLRKTGPIVRWDGTDEEVGEDLRRAVRVVRLGADMRPAEVVRRDLALVAPAQRSKAWRDRAPALKP